MHLHGGQTCQINTRGYFCNIQQVSAVHQTALAAYFRWQRFIHFSWTIKSLALFGYAHLLRRIFPLKHFAEDRFPNGDHQSHFYQPTSELPAHVPKAGSSRGVRLPGYQGVLWAHNLGISALLHLAQPCVVLSVRLYSRSQKKLKSSGSGMRPMGPNRIIRLVCRFTFEQQPYCYSLSFLFLIIIVNSFNLHKHLPFKSSCKNSHSHYIFCNFRKNEILPLFPSLPPSSSPVKCFTSSPVKHFLSHTQPSPPSPALLPLHFPIPTGASSSHLFLLHILHHDLSTVGNWLLFILFIFFLIFLPIHAIVFILENNLPQSWHFCFGRCWCWVTWMWHAACC